MTYLSRCHQFALTLVLILLSTNALVWAVSTDASVAESEGAASHEVATASQHERDCHKDGEEHQHNSAAQGCDHSCHASAHLVAIRHGLLPVVSLHSPGITPAAAVSILEVPNEPPFIPPIA